MNVNVTISNNEDGWLEPIAMELGVRLSEVLGPDHVQAMANAYGITIDIDDQGIYELLRLISKEG
ncbi:hypothetical protein [Propionibacterium acidifaciens]|uniref:hypothetical protein n=1 Tax=Propionibacterium acidifaciens TaxID=556499 RepID=UPI00361A0F13